MSKKATYLGALMDAGVRALGIAGGGLAGYNLMPGSGLTKAAGAALGGSVGGNVASSLLQRMDRNQYIGVGRKGVKPVKVKKHIIINEGINALREVRTSALVPVRVAGPSARMRPLEGRQTSAQAKRAVPDIDGPGIPTARQNPLNQPVRLTGPSQRTARRTAVIGAGGVGGLAAALGSDVLSNKNQSFGGKGRQR